MKVQYWSTTFMNFTDKRTVFMELFWSQYV